MHGTAYNIRHILLELDRVSRRALVADSVARGCRDRTSGRRENKSFFSETKVHFSQGHSACGSGRRPR